MQIFVPPAARVPWGCEGKCPRTTESGEDPQSRPPGPVPTPAPRPSPEIGAEDLSVPASGPPHLMLACGRGLRRAAVRTAGPGARSGFPEVSEHALGWLHCGVRVGGLASDSLAPRRVFSFYE